MPCWFEVKRKIKSIRSAVRKEIKIMPIQGLILIKGKKINSKSLPNIELNSHIVFLFRLYYCRKNCQNCNTSFRCLVTSALTGRLAGTIQVISPEVKYLAPHEMYPNPLSFFLISSSESDSSSLIISFSRQ